MKIEEAIEILQNGEWWDLLIPITTVEGRSDENKLHEAIDTAITALRSMPEAGEPLSLEQLREMHGKPVYEFSEKRWFVVKEVFTKGKPKGNKYDYAEITMTDGTIFNSDLDYDEISNRFYSYPPAHIDRSKWEPCGACKNDEITIHVPEFRAMAVCNQHMDREAFDLTLRLKFCSWCGRPLTEKAWEKLERRLRE